MLRTNISSWPQFNLQEGGVLVEGRWPSDMISRSICSSGCGFAPRFDWAASVNTELLKAGLSLPSSSSRPQVPTAASKAWPAEDEDGGKRAVLVSARQRSNS